MRTYLPMGKTSTISKNDFRDTVEVALKLKGFSFNPCYLTDGNLENISKSIRFIIDYARKMKGPEQYQKYAGAKKLFIQIFKIKSSLPKYCTEPDSVIKLRVLLAPVKVQVFCDGQGVDLFAPEGYWWKLTEEISASSISSPNSSISDLNESIKNDLMEIILHGLEKVTREDCLRDIRYNEGDDNWGKSLSPDAPNFIEIKDEI